MGATLLPAAVTGKPQQWRCRVGHIVLGRREATMTEATVSGGVIDEMPLHQCSHTSDWPRIQSQDELSRPRQCACARSVQRKTMLSRSLGCVLTASALPTACCCRLCAHRLDRWGFTALSGASCGGALSIAFVDLGVPSGWALCRSHN